MSSCFVEERVSIPGKAAAILRKRGCSFTFISVIKTQATNTRKNEKYMLALEEDNAMQFSKMPMILESTCKNLFIKIFNF